MPGMNGTGPAGAGPRTGRQMGRCEGARGPMQGFGMGRGAGMRLGAGRGFGWRMRFFAPQQPVELSREDQRKILEQELADIEAEKQAVKKRLEELQ